MLAGTLVFRYVDREETHAALDAYYAPPGHVPLSSSNTQTIEFSSAAELRATMEVVGRNIQQLAEDGSHA